MLIGKIGGTIQLPTMIQDLLEFEFRDCLTFHAKPRTRHACLLFQDTLRRTSNQSGRENCRFTSLPAVDYPNRLTVFVDCYAADVRV